MKYVYSATYVLFLIDVFARGIWKDFFQSYPFAVNVYLTLTTSAVSLCLIYSIVTYHNSSKYIAKKNVHVSLFTLLFIFTLITPAASSYAMVSALKKYQSISTDQYRYLPIDRPINEIHAQLFYVETGVVLPYAEEQGEYKLFSPSDEDIKSHLSGASQEKELLRLENFILDTIKINQMFLVSKGLIFILLLIVVLRVNRSKLKKSPTQPKT